MFRRISSLACLALAAACTPIAQPQPAGAAEASFLVKDVRLFDGERVTERTDVLVEGGRIVRVGRNIATAGSEVIDGAGKTLLPGLIDSHVHGYPGAAEEALRFGVTAEIEMFSMAPRDVRAALRAERESLARTARADIWSAGIGVTMPQGIIAKGAPPGAFPTLGDEGDAAAFVAARVAEGSDHIKIFYDVGRSASTGQPRFETFSPDQLGRIIAAAHANGLRAIVHTATLEDSRTALERGADGLAHMFGDAPVDESFAAAARARGLFIIPTFSAIAGASATGDGRRVAEDPLVRPFLTSTQISTLTTATRGPSERHILDTAATSIGRLHRAGVAVVAGTDAPNPGTAHGAAMAIELGWFVRSGLTPVEALRAATSLPARLFRLGDRGRVAPGMRADLLLVEGDPTRDIAALHRIAAIWKNGYRIGRTPPREEPRTG